MPVITWATVTISESLRQLPGKHEIKTLQKKKAILGTAHILQEVLT
jgi:hypothetical protein